MCYAKLDTEYRTLLQRGVNSISLQCITLPVACSEWGACLTDFRFWGQMTPKVKIFENFFPDSSTGHRDTFSGQIRWKSAVGELPKGRLYYHTKNSRSAGLVPAPILPKIGRSRPKFRKRCYPLICLRIPNLVRIGCVLLDLFRKDWFFSPKSQYNIGFQHRPTITVWIVISCSLTVKDWTIPYSVAMALMLMLLLLVSSQSFPGSRMRSKFSCCIVVAGKLGIAVAHSRVNSPTYSLHLIKLNTK